MLNGLARKARDVVRQVLTFARRDAPQLVVFLTDGLPTVDLLKAAHHGSRTATTAALLAALQDRRKDADTLAERALYDAQPLSKNAYKVDVALSLLRRGIATLTSFSSERAMRTTD